LSRDYKNKRVVIYPAYIDSSLSRKEGRRIPKSIAVHNPRVEEIVRAAEELGLNPVIEDSRYPKFWWKYKVRVIVDKVDSKQRILRMIAEKINEFRRAR